MTSKIITLTPTPTSSPAQLQEPAVHTSSMQRRRQPTLAVSRRHLSNAATSCALLQHPWHCHPVNSLTRSNLSNSIISTRQRYLYTTVNGGAVNNSCSGIVLSTINGSLFTRCAINIVSRLSALSLLSHSFVVHSADVTSTALTYERYRYISRYR